MKKLLLAATLVGAIFASQSCKKKVDIDYDLPNKPTSSASASVDSKLTQVLRANAPKAETFTVDAATGKTFSTSNGTRYTIDPNIFEKQDGTPVTGNVNVVVKELFNPSQMILDDKPTMTSTGQMLESFGEFKVDAVQGTDVLKLKQAAVVKVQVVRRDTINVGLAKGIPMWDGDTILQTVYKGYNYVNEEATVVKESILRKGIDWVQRNNVATSTGSSLNFTIDKLGAWSNCDAFMMDTGPKTTVLGYFNNIYNDSTSASNLLFFKRSGTKTLVKIYNPILEGPSDKKGYLSYQNSFPQGMSGTFLAIVYKGGKYYTAMQDVTIAQETGKTFMGIDFVLAERTEAEMLNDINLVNSK